MGYENGQWVEDDDPFTDPSTRSPNLPSAPQYVGPVPSATPFDPRSQDTFDYGNGTVANKTSGGWQYDWRAQPYQDLLSDSDVAQQRQLTSARGSGQATAADDAGALWQMSHPGGAAGGAAVTPFQNSAPSFDDPASRLVEDSALARYQHLQNPEASSGTSMFEQYARQLADTLKGPVYSAQDESIIKGRAIDAIMTEKDQTKQRWLEEMSRRGIPPSSGPALEGLQRIEQHYGQLHTQVQSQFAQNAIDQTRQQRTQVLDTYGQLAGSEEGRLREANTYAAIPQQLQDNAFQRNLQLVGAGGSPQSLTQTLLGLAQYGQNADAQRSQARAQQTAGLMQLLGYYFGGQ